jgi:tetratricopeptide (TPR) repeat protein
VNSEAQALPTNVLELVEWFEDIAANDLGTRIVELVAADPQARLGTLQRFYAAVAQHPRFGGTWPDALMPASLVPAVVPTPISKPLRFFWLGLVATADPCVETMQVWSQLQQVARFPDAPPWFAHANVGEFAAVLGAPALDSVGHQVEHTFAFLGAPPDARAAVAGSALRLLDDAVEAPPLLADGGALGLDAPRARARALVVAGWLQRLAVAAPVALVVDDAAGAGTFVVELVRALAGDPARVLIVLAGPSTGMTAALAAAEPADRLVGEHADLPTVTAPDATALANVAAALPSPVFTRDAFDLASHDEADAHAALLRLASAGWVRPLTDDVWAFASAQHWEIARSHAADAAAQETRAAVRAKATARLFDRRRLAHFVDYGIAATADAPRDVRERYASLLASVGELDRAGEVDTSGAEAHVAAAARTARTGPTTAAREIARAFQLLGTASDATDDAVRLRLAIARVSLATGAIDDVFRALGTTVDAFLSPRVGEQLVALRQWSARPGVVARSVDVLANLQLIATLRAMVPDSRALAHALLARIELLEQLDRIAVADDVPGVVDEACAIFERGQGRATEHAWRARRWRAWCQHRRGDTATALAGFDAVLAEQRACSGYDAAHVLVTRRWRAQVLSEIGRAADALGECADVRARWQGAHTVDAYEAFLLDQLEAACLLHLGRVDDAIRMLDDLVARRITATPPVDELLLHTLHTRARALARAGRLEDAIADLDVVIAERGLIDVPEAPRILIARYERAGCLRQLGRVEDAVVEFDAMVDLDGDVLDDAKLLLTDARGERGLALLLLARFRDALDDLDHVIEQRSLAHGAGALDVLSVRQQRAACLAALRRVDEARAELDAIDRAIAGQLPDDDPLVASVRDLRAQLGADQRST